jgi:hypothetical protein
MPLPGAGIVLVCIFTPASVKRARRVEHGESATPWPPVVRSRPDQHEPRD